MTEEIKTDPRRRVSEQLRRIHEVRASLWDGAALPGDDPRHKLVELPIQFATNLDLLHEATQQAAEHGVAATLVPGGRALLVVDQFGCMNAGVTAETYQAAFEQVYTPVRRAAGIDARDATTVAVASADAVARNPRTVPWALYPLDPALCARLIGDITVFLVQTSGRGLVERMVQAGLPARWVGPGTADNRIVVELTQATSIPLPRGYTLEDQRVLQVSRSELDRYLLELIDPDTWFATTRFLLDSPPGVGQPWPHYRGEEDVWV